MAGWAVTGCSGPAANDPLDRILYNPITGALIFDVKGSNGGGAMQIATLSPGLFLTAADFVVF